MSRAGTADDLLGRTLGSYELTGVIGRGSLGVVYAARHVQLGGASACKVLHRELTRDHALVERFRAEAQRATRVRHPNTLDLFDIGELPDGRIYYLMEQLAGRPLAEVLGAGALPFAEVVEIGRQLCEGLAAAHAAGVVRHDLRLGSIYVLERPGELPLVKLADFGQTRVTALSFCERRSVGVRQIDGAPEHLAPERIRGGAGDERADVYALGAVLYRLCSGEPLFGRPGLGELLRAHLYAPPPKLPPQTLATGVPRDMDALLQKALAKVPAERYATVEQLEADLLRIARNEAPLALGYYRTHTQGTLAVARRRLAGLRSRRWALPLLGILGIAVAAVLLRPTLLARWAAHRNKVPPAAEVNVAALRALALDVLQQGRQAADPSQRVLALRALGQSRDPRHREILQSALTDPLPAIRREAASALGALGVRAAAPALLRCAEAAADPQTLLACAEALDRLDMESAQPLLRKVVALPDAAAAVAAALLLEARGDAAARQYLDTRLAEPGLGPSERALVLERRALRGDKAAQAQAIDLLDEHKDNPAPPQLRLEVAASLVKLDDPRARAALIAMAEQGGPQQVLAAELLCATDDLFGQPLLRQVFREPERPLAERLLATEGLGACGDRDDLRALGQTLQHGEPQPSLRQVEAGSLLRLCANDPALVAEQSLNVAVAGLHDDSPVWREAAVAALTGADPQQAVPLLGQALKEDRQPEVRRRAANALAQTRQAGAMAELGAAMNDQDRDVRFTVFRSLGAVGSSLRATGSSVDPAVRTRVQSELSARANSSDPTEQVVASAALLRLGDDRHRDKLRSSLMTSNREALQAAIEEVAADRELQRKSLPQLLSHPDFAVRMQAATALALAGERSGIGVLREALARGEAEAIQAYGLLLRLGESAALPPRSAEAVTHGDLKTRLASLEAALQLPVEPALDLLGRASRDPDAVVRRRVVELLDEVALGSHLSIAVGILRRLQNDTDAVVRSLATVVLARWQPRRSAAASEKTKAGPTQAPPAPAAAVPDLAAPGGAAVPDLASPGPAAADAAAPEPPADPGAAVASGTADEAPAPAGEAGGNREAGAAIRKALHAGLSALKNDDPAKAQRLLEKVNSSCARSRKDAAAVCAELAYELSLALGRVYEAESQWALAMRAYDKLRTVPGAHPTAPQRAEVAAAIKRLSPRLGQVIIPRIAHKRCQESVVWMVPGTHTVNLHGEAQQVRVRAQETIKVGQCP
jgi:HEAT repeat protein